MSDKWIKSYFKFFACLAKITIIFLATFLFSWPALSEQIQGRVVGVHDGDTFTLLQNNNQQTKIRLAEIDSPESNQSYGNKAKQELSYLIFGKTVTVTIFDKDRYGRTVGRVFEGNIYVNAEMINRGAAWVYLKYAKDRGLFQLEALAKQNRLGLWNLPENQRIPPWQWRHPTNTNIPISNTIQNANQNDTVDFSCTGKQSCRQMISCEEAIFYLEHCGLLSIDGNHDGIPCNKLCR